MIPCLLMLDGALIKTTRFASPRYVGDPLNAVRIFNEKRVDELIVLDIGATSKGSGIEFDLVSRLASECRMPLCYGGGVSSVADADRLVSLGVEKVAMSAAAVGDPALVSSVARTIGNQSVLVAIDVRKTESGSYEVVTHNGLRQLGADPIMVAQAMEDAGAGEILVNSVDRDGMLDGYDIPLAESIRDATSLPLSILGGASSADDIRSLVAAIGVVGAAAGSLFVFRGKYRAVLISYVTSEQNEAIALAVDP